MDDPKALVEAMRAADELAQKGDIPRALGVWMQLSSKLAACGLNDEAEHCNKSVGRAQAQVTALKEEGNVAFAKKRWGEARDAYTRALAICPGDHLILGNRSAAALKEGDAQAAYNDAHAALNRDAKWAKVGGACD